jgi:hypothetical protein
MISAFRQTAELLPSFISENVLVRPGGMMVSFKVDADTRAKLQGAEDLEKYPIVAKVKGTGKEGGLMVQVSGDTSPVSARIAGDPDSPIAIAPISIVPDLKNVLQSLDLGELVTSITKISEGLKIGVSNDSGSPIPITLGSIPVDLTVSVYSPSQEPVFKVEIKGSVGGR